MFGISEEKFNKIKLGIRKREDEFYRWKEDLMAKKKKKKAKKKKTKKRKKKS